MALRKRIIREGGKGGKISAYSVDARYGILLPSKARVREILRQAIHDGATKVGIVAEVEDFQGYEMEQGERQVVRDFRLTPQALRAQIGASKGNMRALVLGELRAASGAEEVAGLRGFQLNFYYG